MRKISVIILSLLGNIVFSQETVSVEKSIFSMQTGLVGVWLNNELKLSSSIVLRSEVGLEPSWFIGQGTQWHPNFRLEPRNYYNLKKRTEKGLDISNNSGNFWGVALNYRPDAIVFSNEKGLTGVESYSIVPKFGIRRNIGKNFNYETGIGFGFRHETNYGNYGELDLHLRIGYSF